MSATVADLRPVDLFDDLSDAELEPWAAVARWHTYAPGEFLAHADEEPPGVLFLLEGTVRTLRCTTDTSPHLLTSFKNAINILTSDVPEQ